MFERRIDDSMVRNVISRSEIIEKYPEDKPFPSVLLLGFSGKTPIHVVVGMDDILQRCYVITVYEPDPNLWEADFKKRKVL
jgi:hypothetical protein